MPKANPSSPLVSAAAALDDELRGFAELAREVKRVSLDGEKSLARAAKLLEQSGQRQARIQETLRALVAEIDKSRALQSESLDAIVEVARSLEARAAEFDAIMKRFAALGASANAINAMTIALSTKQKDGANETQMLAGIRELEEAMIKVVVEAEDLTRDAHAGAWPEVARQADAIRQQVLAAKNKVVRAHRTLAERGPS